MNNTRNEILISETQLEKLEKIRKLIAWPMAAWFFIAFCDAVSSVLGGTLAEIKKIIAEVAFYAFPLVLLYLAFIVFYSSYRILESRNYKNVIVFAFFQVLTYYLLYEIQIEIKLPSDKSVLFTIILAVVIFLAVFAVQLFIKLPENADSSSADIELINPRLGLIVSGLFSILIASLIFFNKEEGFGFVKWGVIFGIFLSALFVKTQKTILGLFYFLNPSSASYLYRIIRLKERVENEKRKQELRYEEEVLEKEMMRSKLVETTAEIDRKVTRIKFDEAKKSLNSLLERIEDPNGNMTPSEKAATLSEIGKLAEGIKKGEPTFALQEPDYKSYSFGERMSLRSGFDDTEIDQLLAEGYINPSQKYFWKKSIQEKIKISANDFDKSAVIGEAPILAAKCLERFFKTNKPLVEALTEQILHHPDKLKTFGIMGTSNPQLFELHFKTIIKKHIAIFSYGESVRDDDQKTYLIFLILECPKAEQ